MNAAEMMPAARARFDNVRDHLPEVRAHLADVERGLPDLQLIARKSADFVGRATGRKRRSRWPWVVLSSVIAASLIVAVGIVLMNRWTNATVTNVDTKSAALSEAAGTAKVREPGLNGTGRSGVETALGSDRTATSDNLG